jgi:hypothetical protein
MEACSKVVLHHLLLMLLLLLLVLMLSTQSNRVMMLLLLLLLSLRLGMSLLWYSRDNVAVARACHRKRLTCSTSSSGAAGSMSVPANEPTSDTRPVCSSYIIQG